ncbi:DNA repair exonuclease [Rhizobium sp. 57MFTsu3.2]|uniref:metallophosphoesterase family protein n=1 Tax=Rhizobium sp. 57MFTsu3.2 TaxID=1048681 RepID=UPI00146A70A2|nr:DNA repair exonuclease [Rhizobium sp. 57MFTsu3.2]NMN71932.1 DNA repair exonuclease SbcCD nuclease subunit [Rhizobium sp. 57MFTsu3.2]
MTSFRFIHAADLHLGSPFKGLSVKDEQLAALFSRATREAVTLLVSRAVELAVDFVVIAGDIYDGDWKDNKVGLFFNREMGRLQRAGIPVYLIRGNHDAASVITKTITLPDNVREFATSKPSTFLIDEKKVALHGQGFTDRAAYENLAIGYPSAIAGWYNIGVLHTSMTGREGHEAYAPCSVDDLRSRAYDYWALGHVHEFEIVASDPLVVFPGNLQGRSIREQGAKGAVLVTVDDGIATVDRLIVDSARFISIGIDVSEGDLDVDVLKRIEEEAIRLSAEFDGKPVAARIRISGACAFYDDLARDRAQWQDEVLAACQRAYSDIWIEKLELRLSSSVPVAATPFAGIELFRALEDHGDDAIHVDQILMEILPKMPGGLATNDSPLGLTNVELVKEARELLLARMATAG